MRFEHSSEAPQNPTHFIGSASPSATQMSGPGHPLASNSPGQLFIPFPSPQSAIVQGPQFAATASAGGGHVSPAAQSTMIQFIGVSQPFASTGPAQLDMTNPQWGCLRGGQTYGHSSPSATQMSGIGHALWSKLPGQLFIPFPQSIGAQGMQLSAAASAGGGHCSPAAHSVDGPRTVGHDKSAVGGFDMWTEEWALVSLSNADLRHRASHRVGVIRTASHTFSTVSGRERWAIMGRHSQGSGDESEEQERHLEAFSARQFSHVLYIDTTA